jgi:hypothetical protein
MGIPSKLTALALVVIAQGIGSVAASEVEWQGNAVTVGAGVYGCSTIDQHRIKSRDPARSVEGCYLLHEEQLIRVVAAEGEYFQMDTPIAFGDLYLLYVPRHSVRPN